MLPRLERHLAERLDSVASYQLLYHEAALANLLEVRHRGLVINCARCCCSLGAGWGLSSVPVELPALAAMPCVLRRRRVTGPCVRLQVLLFHRDACEAVAEEALIELCDW